MAKSTVVGVPSTPSSNPWPKLSSPQCFDKGPNIRKLRLARGNELGSFIHQSKHQLLELSSDTDGNETPCDEGGEDYLEANLVAAAVRL